MKTIALIKYHGATNTKGSRVSITFPEFKVFISYDYECNSTQEMIQKHWQIIAEKWRKKSLKDTKEYNFSFYSEIEHGEPVYIAGVDEYGIEYKVITKPLEK